MDYVDAIVADAEAAVAEAVMDYQLALEDGNPGVIKAAFALLVAAKRDEDAVHAVRDAEVATRAALIAYT